MRNYNTWEIKEQYKKLIDDFFYGRMSLTESNFHFFTAYGDSLTNKKNATKYTAHAIIDFILHCFEIFWAPITLCIYATSNLIDSNPDLLYVKLPLVVIIACIVPLIIFLVTLVTRLVATLLTPILPVDLPEQSHVQINYA